jgi:hypothetical protein
MNNDQLAFGNDPPAVMLTGESEQPLSIFSGLVTVQEPRRPDWHELAQTQLGVNQG